MWLIFLASFGLSAQSPVRTIGTAPKIEHPKIQIVSVSQRPKDNVLSVVVEAAEPAPFESLRRLTVSIQNATGRELFRVLLNRSSECDPGPPGAFGACMKLDPMLDNPTNVTTVAEQRDVMTPHGVLLASSQAQNEYGLLRAVFDLKPVRWKTPDCIVKVYAQVLAKSEKGAPWMEFRTPVHLDIETWGDAPISPDLLGKILDGLPSSDTLSTHLKHWSQVETVRYFVSSGTNEDMEKLNREIARNPTTNGNTVSRIAYSVHCQLFQTPCGARGRYSGDILPGALPISLGERGVYWEGRAPCFANPPHAKYINARSVHFIRGALVTFITQFRIGDNETDPLFTAKQQHELRQLASLIDRQIHDLVQAQHLRPSNPLSKDKN